MSFPAELILYSPGAGVTISFLAFGRLCSESAGGVSFPLAPSPRISYGAGPGPNVSLSDL